MSFLSLMRRRSTDFRSNPETPLKLFYLTYFGALGAILPYLNLHFHLLGFSGAQIGLLASIVMGANLGMAPALTAFADFWGRRKGIFVFCLVATTVIFSLMLFAHSFVWVAVVVLVFASFRSPLVPMANAMTFEQLAGRGEEYGRIRIWGSVGFVILALLVGRLVDSVGTTALIYAGVLAYALCSFFAARGIRPEPRSTETASLSDLFSLLKNRRFTAFMVCSFLVALSGSPYIVFFAISMKQTGISQSVVGVSWMAAVVAEILFMVYSPRIIRRYSMESLMVFSYLTWGLRWYLMSVVSSPLLIVFVHLLHGINFGLYYPVAMNFLNREVPPSLKNTGQGLFAAVSYSMGGILGNFASGLLYESLGLVTLYRVGALAAVVSAMIFIVSLGVGKQAGNT